MKRKKMQHAEAVSTILSQVLKDKGIAKKIVQYSIFEVWEEIVGTTIAKHTEPLRVVGDTLVVKTKNPAWANELTFMKPEILKKIHKHIPDGSIKEIRFTAATK
jgi:predicted nucleic acid-binding Zn ribbon protein